MKFKVGDRVKTLNSPQRGRVVNAQTAVSYYIEFEGRADYPHEKYQEDSLELVEENQKMQNKNKILIAGSSFEKRGNGMIWTETHNNGTYISPCEIPAFVDFLSTPYQEEEVYVKSGDRFKYGNCEFILTDLGEGSLGLTDLSSGRLIIKRLVLDVSCTTLKDLVGVYDISEWEAIK